MSEVHANPTPPANVEYEELNGRPLPGHASHRHPTRA
jgi:hypothetical protein